MENYVGIVEPTDVLCKDYDQSHGILFLLSKVSFATLEFRLTRVPVDQRVLFLQLADHKLSSVLRADARGGAGARLDLDERAGYSCRQK